MYCSRQHRDTVHESTDILYIITVHTVHTVREYMRVKLQYVGFAPQCFSDSESEKKKEEVLLYVLWIQYCTVRTVQYVHTLDGYLNHNHTVL